MAFIIEKAGGKASTGTKRILDLKVSGAHDKCGIICGTKEEVDAVE